MAKSAYKVCCNDSSAVVVLIHECRHNLKIKARVVCDLALYADAPRAQNLVYIERPFDEHEPSEKLRRVLEGCEWEAITIAHPWRWEGQFD